MSARIIVLASAVLIALTGCSHGWTKPGGSDEGRYRLDAYACARDAGVVGLALGMSDSEGLFRDCMEARGYVRAPG